MVIHNFTCPIYEDYDIILSILHGRASGNDHLPNKGRKRIYMELRIAKSYLSQGIQIVSKAVPSKTTMSILECILIDASGNNIRLIANDMELGIETVVPGLILSRGIIAVDAQIFSSIVRKLPDDDVIIFTEGEKITITCQKAKFTILGKDGTDFSYLPEIEKKNEVRISQYTLRDLISRTIFSISGNESSGMMTGELLEIRDNRLRMVALDGHRIAIRNVQLGNSYEDRKVIDGITLDIKENTTTAIVGPSGGGKTTLCQLVPRFYDVDEGSICIDGNPKECKRIVRQYPSNGVHYLLAVCYAWFE